MLLDLRESLDALAQLVRERRYAPLADPEIIGVLTHHKKMTTETWRVLEALFEAVATIPRVSWVAPIEVFAHDGLGSEHAPALPTQKRSAPSSSLG